MPFSGIICFTFPTFIGKLVSLLSFVIQCRVLLLSEVLVDDSLLAGFFSLNWILDLLMKIPMVSECFGFHSLISLSQTLQHSCNAIILLVKVFKMLCFNNLYIIRIE